MTDDVRDETAIDANKPVMVPGDPEKRAWQERINRGIPVPGHVWEEIRGS